MKPITLPEVTGRCRALRKCLLPVAASLSLCAIVSWIHAAESPADSKADRLAQTVFLDEIAVKNLRIQTVEAEEQVFEESILALGRVEVLPGNRAVVSSRIPGTAVSVTALPDHEIKAGAPAIVVESRHPVENPVKITLSAPIAGYVVDLAIAPGDPVVPEKPLLSIVDLSRVYALARVPEHLAHRLIRGQEVRITSPGWPDEFWESRIEHLGAMADPTSGTLEVACIVDNEGTWLRPGMRLEFHIVTRKRSPVMAVPVDAVQGTGPDRFVFVADDSIPHAFARAPVVVGARNDRWMEITEGLLPGDRVVTTGAYSLAFAGKGNVSLKEALDAAHGHEHNEDGSEKTSALPNASSVGSANHDHSHDHSSQAEAISGWARASFIGNGVLLALLLIATWRRRVVEDPPKDAPKTPSTPENGHAG